VAQATDVAKAAASLFLTKPGLGEIILAIDASRRIYRRMQTFILTLLTRKTTFPVLLSLGVLALNAFVVSPLMLVLLMITTDVGTLAVSTDQVTASASFWPSIWSKLQLAT
jgi:H+-transporting ATPase